jgi:quinol monooxygenase YgiN
MRKEATAMPGNIAYRVHASHDNDTGITLVEEWEDEASFAGYQASEAFVRLNRALRPAMTDAPVSRRFRANLLETVA